jgi:hypothetical protein
MSGTITRIGATGAGALLALGMLAAPAGATGAGKGGSSGRNSQTTACFTATGHTQGRSHSDPDGMSNGGADKPGCTGGFDADRDGNNGCGNDADREDDNNGRCGGPKPERVRDQRATTAEVKAEKQENRGDSDGRCHHDGTTTTTESAGAVAGNSSGKCACPLGSEGAVAAPDATAPDATASAAGGGTAVGTAVGLSATAPATTGTGVAAGTTTPDATASATGAATPDAAVDAAAVTPDTLVLGESLTRPSVLARTGAGVGGLALLGGLLCGGGRLTLLARRLLRIG